MAKRSLLLVCAIAALVAVVGCGSSGEKKTTTSATTGTTASKLPRIIVFKGPSAVPCGKKGEIHTLVFVYMTRNATSVEPEIDGEAPGAQAGYDPRGGKMRFNYICPGPHTLTISAFNDSGQSASRSVGVVPED
jgi:hypothetical protein